MLETNKKLLTSTLLSWYDINKRDLPWRRHPSPYHIWISEVMLQQTQVKTVLPYYHRFLEAYPTIADLAETDHTRLHKLWEGLGYYTRADNLRRAALTIVNHYNGVLPADYHKLLELPGIGPYTAGAIASMAFQLPYAAVDGNVLRVYSRILAYEGPVNASPGKGLLTKTAEALVPEKRPGDFNQALMDLGATLCLAKGEPHCPLCPWQPYCRASALENPSRFPIKKPRKARRIEERTLVLPVQKNRVWIQKRPETGLLSGLWEFINLEGKISPEELPVRLPLPPSIPNETIPLGRAKHFFTHIEWHMTGYLVKLPDHPEITFGTGRWVTLDELEAIYSLPSAFMPYRNKLPHILQD